MGTNAVAYPATVRVLGGGRAAPARQGAGLKALSDRGEARQYSRIAGRLVNLKRQRRPSFSSIHQAHPSAHVAAQSASPQSHLDAVSDSGLCRATNEHRQVVEDAQVVRRDGVADGPADVIALVRSTTFGLRFGLTMGERGKGHYATL